jgi:beta-barrel assembly-enhancing protease
MLPPVSERSDYSNPAIPEGINVGDEHPLKEFFWLTGGIAVLTVLVVMALAWLGAVMGSVVSFETERRIAAGVATRFGNTSSDSAADRYLQELADRLTRADALPPGMSVQIHYVDDAAVNAFATLGGHIVVTRGLIEAMPNENALATVLAHEIAHVKERHVMRSLGRGVLISVALGILTGATGDDLAGDLVGSAGVTTALGFSRDQEHEADRIALANVAALYGHVRGAAGLFEALERRADAAPPEWLSTHPDPRNRIAALHRQAEQAGWTSEGATTPLPPLLPARQSADAAAKE